MKLSVGDNMLHENMSHDLLSILLRWAIGKYTHASMFAGLQDDPNGKAEYCTFESIGVGPTLTPMSKLLGNNVIVIKMPLTKRDRVMLAAQARRIADNPLYQYGYDDVLTKALPAALCRKFGWKHKSTEDVTGTTQICNKAVGLVYFESKIRNKLPDIIDLPPDLLLAPGATIYGGKIGQEITW